MAEELSWIRARKKGKKDISKQKLIRGAQMLLENAQYGDRIEEGTIRPD